MEFPEEKKRKKTTCWRDLDFDLNLVPGSARDSIQREEALEPHYWRWATQKDEKATMRLLIFLRYLIRAVKMLSENRTLRGSCKEILNKKDE